MLPPEQDNQSIGPDEKADPESFFTSDLSIKEFMLVKDAGFDPVGMVAGSSIYHVGFQNPKMTDTQEVEILSKSLNQARNMSLSRMVAEASALKADGIVGVRLRASMQQWSENLAEFYAVGTAVRSSTPGSFLTPRGRPFTSNLSGQDFWVLIKAGYRPVSYVVGSYVCHIGYQGIQAVFAQVGLNAELPGYTKAVSEARQISVARMRSEGIYWGGEGVVGVNVEENSYGWYSHIIEFFASGTSITSAGNTIKTSSPATVLPMFDLPGLSR